MDLLNNVLLEIVLIGGALAALTQWVFRPVYRSMRAVHKASAYISDEMSFNSGSTMRDAIERLEQVNLLFAEKLGVEIPNHLLPQYSESPHEHSSHKGSTHKKGTHPT